VAWATQSRRAHAQLARLLAPHPLHLLDFAEGRSRLQQVTAQYERASQAGWVLPQQVAGWDALAPTLAAALQAQPAADAAGDWTLLVQDADTRGVYLLDTATLLHRAQALLRWDGNTLLLAAPGLQHGLLLDCEVGDDDSVQLQLETWSATGWAARAS
jgi:hypothetical protein